MEKEDKQFLQDFVVGTELWLKEIKAQSKISKLEKGQCVWCGTDYNNMERLAEIIKEYLFND